MKHYYYADRDQQLGPFTFEELKAKQLRKATLVWTEGFPEWTYAENILELQDILISEPPPLPSQSKKVEQIDNSVKVKISSSTSSSSLAQGYTKEIEATAVGILSIVITVIIKEGDVFTFESEESYNQARIVFVILSLAFRIFVTDWIVGIAKRQNRNQTGWGWFAFFLPSLALIIIGLLKKLQLKIDLDSSLSIEEQSNILRTRALELKMEGRMKEALSIFQKIEELNPDFPNVVDEITKCKNEIDISKSNLVTIRKFLFNGQILEYERSIYDYQIKGAKVRIDGLVPDDCIVRLKYEDYRYEISNGKVSQRFFIDKFKQRDGTFLEVDTLEVVMFGNKTKKGSRVWVNNLSAPDGVYKIGLFGKAIIKNGVVAE